MARGSEGSMHAMEPASNRGSVKSGRNSEYSGKDLQAKAREVANKKLRGTEGLKDLNEGLQPHAEQEGLFNAKQQSKSMIEAAKARKNQIKALADESAKNEDGSMMNHITKDTRIKNAGL